MFRPDNRVPKSFKECYETDSISDNLWSWSEKIELWGERILILLTVIGVITTFVQAVAAANVDGGFALFVIIITIGTQWFLYALIEYCAYHVLALLIGSLAMIVQNTKISAKIAMYKMAKEEGVPNEEKTGVHQTMSQNAGYSLSKMSEQRENRNGFWVCKNCGTENQDRLRHCKDCGKYR